MMVVVYGFNFILIFIKKYCIPNSTCAEIKLRISNKI